MEPSSKLNANPLFTSMMWKNWLISSILPNCILPKKELPALCNGYCQTTSKPTCWTVPCKHTTSSQSSGCLDNFIANLIRNRSQRWVLSSRHLIWPFLKVNNCNQYCDILLYHFLLHATGQILTEHWKIILVWLSGKLIILITYLRQKTSLCSYKKYHEYVVIG